MLEPSPPGIGFLQAPLPAPPHIVDSDAMSMKRRILQFERFIARIARAIKRDRLLLHSSNPPTADGSDICHADAIGFKCCLNAKRIALCLFNGINRRRIGIGR